MKRDPALVALSRDHHTALVHALELRRACRGPGAEAARRSARAFLDFVEAELRGHFADEEVVVFPAADAVDRAAADRARDEHREIESLVQELLAGLEREAELRPLCGRLGDLLHDHVRFEERALFESLQRGLSPEALERLGRALDAHRSERGRAPGCTLS